MLELFSAALRVRKSIGKDCYLPEQASINRCRRAGVALVAAVALSSRGVYAVDATWVGAPADANWSNGSNWGGVSPGATSGSTDTSTATFSQTLTNTFGTASNPVVVDAGRNVKFITFDTSAASPYVIGSTDGNAIRVTATGVLTIKSGVVNSQTINAPLQFSGGITISNNATPSSVLFNIDGSLTGLSGGPRLTLQGTNTGDNIVSGAIGESATTALTKAEVGKWILAGTNTYTGVTTIGAGTLSVAIIGDGGVAGNLGKASSAAGNIVFNSGSAATIPVLQYTGNTASTNRNFSIRDLTVSTAGFEVTDPSVTLTLTGGIVRNDGASTLGKLSKTGAGTLALTGTNLYTGATTVSGGTLVVGQAGVGSITSSVAVTVGTFGGSGSTTGAVTIGDNSGTADAKLAPGNSAGTFTAGGALAINSDGVYQFEINSTSGIADQIVANGVTLNANSTFSFTDLGNGAGVAQGQSFVAINNTGGLGISGAFGNLANGATISSNGVTYTANYTGGDGNDLVLTASVVPEPSGLGAFAVGAVGLLGCRRRRSRNA